MKKTILIISLLVYPFLCRADDLKWYKDKIKNDNLSTFYRNEINRKYSQQDIIDSLIGVSGAVPIGTIRSAVNKIKTDQRNKENEIDACTTRECVDAILSVMKHED